MSSYQQGDRVAVTEPILSAVAEPATVESYVKPTRRRPWASVVVRFDDPSFAVIPGRPVLIAASDVVPLREVS
jgi:hypothetical protein